MERLGYGTHLTVEAFQAQQDLLKDESAVRRLLIDLAAVMETNCVEEFLEELVHAEDGFSVARLCSESQLFIHLFPDLGILSCRVFTRRKANLTPIVETLREHFRTGRFESHVSSVSKLAESESGALKAMLQGDRRYARARFDAVSNGP